MFKVIFEKNNLKHKRMTVGSYCREIVEKTLEKSGKNWIFEQIEYDPEIESDGTYSTMAVAVIEDPDYEYSGLDQFASILKIEAGKQCYSSESSPLEFRFDIPEELEDLMEPEVPEAKFLVSLMRGPFRRRVRPQKTTNGIVGLIDDAMTYADFLQTWNFNVSNPDDEVFKEGEDGVYYLRHVEFEIPEDSQNFWNYFVNVLRHIISSDEKSELYGMDEVPEMPIEPKKRGRKSKNNSRSFSSNSSFPSAKPISFNLDLEGLESEDSLFQDFLEYKNKLEEEQRNGDAPAGFESLFDIDAQKRRVLRVLRASKRSEFKHNQHLLLSGPPGCGKTSVANALCASIGQEGIDYLKFDGVACTQAGAMSELFDGDLENSEDSDESEGSDDSPKRDIKIISIEELEKGSESATGWLLGLTDPERQEIRKSTYNEGHRSQKLNCLVIVTVNDIERFRKWQKGALYSRFTTQIRFPRPSRDTLKKILFREIEKMNLDPAMAELVLRFAVDIEENREYYQNDPRHLKAILYNGLEDLYEQQFYDDLIETR